MIILHKFLCEFINPALLGIGIAVFALLGIVTLSFVIVVWKGLAKNDTMSFSLPYGIGGKRKAIKRQGMQYCIY